MANLDELLTKSKPIIMGILNVTPDSFSDGGKYNDLNLAVAHAKQMIEHGADIIDIGGQSTRPGYTEITVEEELKRVIPVVEAVQSISDIPISVDTYYPKVAQKVIAMGVDMINDIKGGDVEGMVEVIAQHKEVGYIFMHSRESTLETLQSTLLSYQEEMANRFKQLGIDRSRTVFDPGIGWKSYEEHLALLREPSKYCDFNRFNVLYGVSRKRTIGRLLDQPNAEKRDIGSTVAHLMAISRGVKIVRVHNVSAMHDAIKVYEELK